MPTPASTHWRQLLAEAQQAFRKGRLDAAEEGYRAALALRPREADILLGLGMLCNHTGRHEEAAALFQRIIAEKPYALEAIGNLGAALAGANRHEEAIGAFTQFLALSPNHALTHYNLGISYKALGRLDEAVAAYRRAIALQPDHAGAFFNLGNALRAQHQPKEAMVAFREALRIDPRHAEACNNLGHTLKEEYAFEESIAHFRRAMEMKPGFADPVSALAGTLHTLGQIEESIALYRHSLKIKPENSLGQVGLIAAMSQSPEISSRDVFEEHVRWATHYAPAVPFTPHGNERSPRRRLRVGYVSPDFYQHSVAFFLENLLAFHDPGQIEIFCYSDVAQADAITARFQGLARRWREIAGVEDEALAAMIRRDEIDILVDLAGHTVGNRLGAFARRPAPVQMAYLGYVDTTGMAQMDYRLVDAHTDPPGMTEALHTERLIRLPETFAVYRPPDEAPPLVPPPALANGHVTFASFGAASKITREQLLSWADLLARVPGSRMLLGAIAFASGTLRERFRAVLASRGISADRVEFSPLQKLPAYLDMHQRVDILLDTFPVNGHTITCHALWMGVPVVSRAGGKYVSRLGASVLANLHLEELLARDAADYVAIAAALAGDMGRLAALRAGMRERMKHSPLMNYAAFARHVEAAYRACWERWCESAPGPERP